MKLYAHKQDACATIWRSWDASPTSGSTNTKDCGIILLLAKLAI
ncbi:MAG: hypothetical protein N2517_09205 [Ignavibacteria bacterium]|nr:hypothetical protein [Ignavibacteria bacterium]